MATDNFDYEDFARMIASQVKDVSPEEFSQDDKEYLENIVYNNTLLAGEALCDDDSLDFSWEQMEMVAQCVGEWTFHKSIDLIRSQIARKHWVGVIQKVAFAVFEVAKAGQIKNIEQSEILAAVEHHVNKSFKEALEDLKEQGSISDDVMEYALSLSNIDDYSVAKAEKEERESAAEALKVTQNNVAQNNIWLRIALKISKIFGNSKKKLKSLKNFLSFKWIFKIFANIRETYGDCVDRINILLSYVLLICVIFFTVSVRLKIVFAGIVTVLFVYFLARDIYTKMKTKELLNQLEDVKQQMRDLVNPDKQYERLGVDLLSVQVGQGLLSIADPDKEGQLLSKFAAIRQSLTDDLGYVIPNIRVMDTDFLEKNEYVISVRGNVVGRGFVYPEKLMVLADQWDATGKEVPENAIVAVEPIYEEKAYWLKPEDIDKTDKLVAIKPEDVIIKHLKELCIKHVRDIMSVDSVEKYFKLIKDNEHVYKQLVDDMILKNLTYIDVQKIFANLIEEKVSIKDILKVCNSLAEYSQYTQDVDDISERIRAALGRQICLSNATQDKVLYVLALSSEWEKTLDDCCQRTELGTMFLLNPMQVQELIETTASTLMRAYQSVGKQPVILCSPRIRLPLYELLERHIPTIVVISYSELITDIKVEAVDTIG